MDGRHKNPLSDVDCDSGTDDSLISCYATVNGKRRQFVLEQTDSGELVRLP